MAKKTMRRSSRKNNGGRQIREDQLIVSRPLRDPSHRFLRTVQAPLVKVAADSGFYFEFVLTALPSSSEFTALYDKFTIERVDQIFVLSSDPGAAVATSALWPTVLYVADYNDSTPPATLNEQLQRGNLEIIQFTPARMSFTRTIRPRCSYGTYRATTIGYSEAPVGALVDMSTPEVPFYGAKLWITNYNTALTPASTITVYSRYHLKMVASK